MALIGLTGLCSCGYIREGPRVKGALRAISNSQDVSLIQRVLITLVPRLIILVNRVFRVFAGFMGKSLVIAVRSSTERNNKLTHMHEQSEFTYGSYLVAAGHF